MQETYLEMQNWFDHVPGNLVLQAESRALDKLMPNLLGYHLLQLGGPQVNLLHNCRIPHRIHISPACPCSFPGTCLVGDYTQLPFLPESIDVALLPHVLEFSKQPRAILEQVSQVLSPRGKVIILGLQPFSMWGLMRRTLANADSSLKQGRFLSSFRIRHWLTVLGFSIESYRTLFFRPPLHDLELLKKLYFVELLGQLLWPYSGAVYMIVAKKHIAPMVWIKPRAVSKRITVPGGIIQPTSRTH